MTLHMKREVEKLKAKLLNLCGSVEKNLCMAVESIRRRDAVLARKVIETDIEIDNMEIDIEEECLKILALHQPVAIDLRFIITALKINNDLERIGDFAVNIAERSEFIISKEPISVPFNFDSMAEKTQTMLTRSLDALVDMDCELAHRVCIEDDEVDDLNRHMHETIKNCIQQHPEWLETLLHLISVSKYLERIADHATNIAEDVIYMVQGKIVRHKN